MGNPNLPAAARIAGRTSRILLVEDEKLLRGLVAQFLRGEGFDVVEAGDGREAVERFSDAGPFDLVLLDLNLPALPGVEVCRRIKERRPEQPVIICSAAILDDHIRGLAAFGVSAFLSKPYHPADLLARIRTELHRLEVRQGVPSPAATAASWRTDRPAPPHAPSPALFKLPLID